MVSPVPPGSGLEQARSRDPKPVVPPGPLGPSEPQPRARALDLSLGRLNAAAAC